MKFSKYTIFSQIKDSENYFMVNLLTGQADILDAETAQKVKSGAIDNKEEFIEKGYLVDPEEERKMYMQKYLDFTDSREKDEIQIFFVPWYTCNFSCSYCFQDEYTPEKSTCTREVIDAFYSYVDTAFAGRKKYITLFGGEPLLAGGTARETVRYFFEKAAAQSLSVAVVTNGYTLVEYMDILKQAPIREVQVTIDGPAEIHDRRRMLKAGNEGTFDQIVAGVDAVLEAGMPVNLRMVIDAENINSLPAFARFAIDKGWTRSPLFKTQLGRNYELHHCQADSTKLFSRVSMYEKIYTLVEAHPYILEFHKPAYSISRFLLENGQLPDPLFDSCPGCKTEWAFDYTGKIYSCTATVGKSEEELGTFYPQVSLDVDAVEEWQDRDITTIAGCRDCSISLACGGGCASVAKNNNGTVCSPDCRPVKELLEMGIGLYFEKEVQHG